MAVYRYPSLHSIVLNAAGQNLRACQGCLFCDLPRDIDMDIPLSSLVQLILMNDEEVLTSRTLWSDSVLAAARSACSRNINLQKVILAMRAEANRREVRG